MRSILQQHANNSILFIAKAPISSITISVETVFNVDTMQGSSLPTRRAYQSISASDVRQICQNACTVTECLKKYNSEFIAPQCAEDGMQFTIPSIIPLFQFNALYSQYPPVVIDSLAVILVYHIYDVLKSSVLTALSINFGGYVFSIQREEIFD